MKTFRTILLGALLGLPLVTHAESDAERELKRVQAEHDKAVKDATEPIKQRYKDAIQAATEPLNQRYQAALERLLERSSRDTDIETAVKIKNALNTLPQVAAKQLAGTWDLRANTGYATTVFFQSNGAAARADGGKFQWHIEGTTLYLGPSELNDRFQLPIVDGKLKGVNAIGNELTMTRK